jgi:tRNA threonylcarbamoyladenosine biosynthesis protein TsaB
MIILALDTSGKYCSMALLQDSAVLASTSGIREEPYASRVFTDLRQILQQTGMQLDQIELFAVARGPGSFTGLRVGLAAVKGWAEVYSRPIAAVSVLEAIAAQASESAPLVVAVVDARGGQVFGGVYRRDQSGSRLMLQGEELIAPQAEMYGIASRQCGGRETPVFVTTSLDAVRAAFLESVFARAELSEVPSELAPLIGRLGLEQSRRGDLVDALQLEANYVRRSDAEVKWRGA